jgi:hypothetical protein
MRSNVAGVLEPSLVSGHEPEQVLAELHQFLASEAGEATLRLLGA